eukprot:3254044-Amphidinium_carterae.1
MARLLLGGTLVRSNGHCPWSATCEMVPSATHALLHGCWRRDLSAHNGYEWLREADPDIMLQLVDNPTTMNLKRLAFIAGSIVECSHLQWFHHNDGTRNRMHQAAWVWCQRHK